MPQLTNVLDQPVVYQLWQAPFVAAKLRPFVRNNDLTDVRRVLDVGCGPGTNSSVFSHTEYLGLDMNPRYIEIARQRHRGDFQVADVREYQSSTGDLYDCIFINSFLHHIDDENTTSILQNMHSLLSDDGHINILELVMPETASIGRWLARHDRGDFARSVERWHDIFQTQFEPVIFEPYNVGLAGVTLWNMVYFKGRPRTP